MRGGQRAAARYAQEALDLSVRLIKPTGRRYAINMATVGLWNRRGTMDEEFLFWDNQTSTSRSVSPEAGNARAIT